MAIRPPFTEEEAIRVFSDPDLPERDRRHRATVARIDEMGSRGELLQYEGRWIAAHNCEIVALADSLDALVAALKKAANQELLKDVYRRYIPPVAWRAHV